MTAFRCGPSGIIYSDTISTVRSGLSHIKRVLLDTLQRGRVEHRFLFTTDGFEMYEWAAKELLLGVCIYGQVIKNRRENRVVRVDRRLSLGTQAELEEALFHSEDSSTLNTSLVVSARVGVFTHGLLQFSATAPALLPGRIHQPGGVLSILLDAYCRTVP